MVNTTLLNLTFTFGCLKTDKPQWYALSADKKTKYLPNRKGDKQPSKSLVGQQHVSWVCEEAFTIFATPEGMRLVVVNLIEEVRLPGMSDRALRRHGFDPKEYRKEQAVKQVVAETGIAPAKTGVVQISERALKRASRKPTLVVQQPAGYHCITD